MKEILAINGGTKAFDEEILRYNGIGKEETSATMKVLESGVLSQYLGERDPDFYGDPKVKSLKAVGLIISK